MNKIGFFLGAGAEVDYGFPSGVKLFCDLVQIGQDKSKKEEISKEVKYLLGENFTASFMTKKDLNEVAESIAEYNKEKLKILYKNFDDEVFSEESSDVEDFKNILGIKFCKAIFNKIEEIKSANAENKNQEKSENLILFYEKMLNFHLGLFILLYGNDFIENQNKKFNLELFGSLQTKEFFKLEKNNFLNFDKEIISKICEPEKERKKIDFLEQTKKVIDECLNLELLFKDFNIIFDYKQNKTKLQKLTTLLVCIKSIIQKCYENSKKQNDDEKETYYKYFSKIKDKIHCICTTNYSNTVIEKIKIDSDKVFFLNGNIKQYLNLETLEISSKNNEPCVPFIFPQIRMKPICSFDLIKTYHDAYAKLVECDKIFILGFNMNKDDILLNSMFKKLLAENKNLKITFFAYTEKKLDEKLTKDKKHKDLCDKLALEEDLKSRFSVELIEPVDDIISYLSSKSDNSTKN